MSSAKKKDGSTCKAAFVLGWFSSNVARNKSFLWLLVVMLYYQVRESSAAAAGAEACGSCGSSSYNYLGALLQLMIPCAGSPASACLSPARSSPAPTARCSAASPPRAPPLLLRSMSILLCFTFLLFTYKECFLQAVGLHMLSPLWRIGYSSSAAMHGTQHTTVNLLLYKCAPLESFLSRPRPAYSTFPPFTF